VNLNCYHLKLNSLLNSTLSTLLLYFLFTSTPPPDIYTLSLHDALPISRQRLRRRGARALPRALDAGLWRAVEATARRDARRRPRDRKSTRLNSSHRTISYAVFCLKKKIVNPILIQEQTEANRSSTLR